MKGILLKGIRAEKTVFRPFIPLLLAMISGIIFADMFPGYLTAAVILILVSIAGLILLFLKQVPSMMLCLVFFFSVGYIALQPWVSPRFPANHVIHLTDDRPYMITGIINETPVDRKHTTRFILLMDSIMQNGSSVPVCGRIRVTVSGDRTWLKKGDKITFYSRIKSIRNFNNPGGFDYQRYMAFKNIWGRAYTQSNKISVLSTETGPHRASVMGQYRAEISALIEQSVTTGKVEGDNVKAVLHALLIGDKTHISMSLRDAFNRAGIGHLLAISGLHIGIVAFWAFWIIRWLVSFIHPLLWLGWSKKTAAVLSFFPVLAYGILSGMSPSTQRAVIMVGVFLLAYLFDRDQDLINTIAVAAMIILVLNPPSLFSISFQLSFAAVLSIVYGLSHFSRTRLQDGSNISSLFGKLLNMAMVTFFAIVGTAPLVMHYFNQVSLIGLFVNMIMVPVIGFTVVPVGLTSVFIYMFSSEAALWCMKIGAAILEKSIHMINFFSELSFAAIKTVTPNIFEICLAYLMLWGLLNWVAVKFKTAENDVGHTLNRLQVAVVILVVTAIAFSADALLAQRSSNYSARCGPGECSPAGVAGRLHSVG
jgi:competence protein ComEC